MTRRADRIAAAALLGLALATALEARTFRVAFLTDPIGPRALPWLAAALLALGGILLWRRPDPDGFWPTWPGALRVGTTVAASLAYAALLQPIGFIAATALLVALLARMFGGRLLPSALAGLLLAAGLYTLFALVLGVPLPIGALFLRQG